MPQSQAISDTHVQIEHLADLDILNFVKFVFGVWFKAPANFHYCPGCLKNYANFKSGQKRLENNPLPSLVSITLSMIGL
jgi:hypothetical protein